MGDIVENPTPMIRLSTKDTCSSKIIAIVLGCIGIAAVITTITLSAITLSVTEKTEDKITDIVKFLETVVCDSIFPEDTDIPEGTPICTQPTT